MSAAQPSRTGKTATNWGAAQVKKPSKNWNNLCLQFVRSCFGVSAKYPNAKKAWENAKFRHTETDSAKIPVGVPVFYRTGTNNWHVVISAGDGGMCYSSDVGGRGKIGRIGIQKLAKAWGITLLGWTEDLNGVRVYTPPKPTPPASKPKPPTKSIAQMATEVILGKHGNGHAQRQKSLGVSASTYAKVRAEVNRRL